MVERIEQDNMATGPVDKHLGELALRPHQPGKLFAVAAEEITALAPSIVVGGEGFRSVILAMNPNNKKLHGEETAIPEKPIAVNRAKLREGKSAYGSYMARVIQTGAQYLASFEDQEEAIRAGQEFIPDILNELLGNMYTERIVPAAPPIRDLHQAVRQTSTEIELLAGEGSEQLNKRYTLLKALGYSDKEEKDIDEKTGLKQMSPQAALGTLYAMSDSTFHKQVATELHTGSYDHLIAQDLLWFVDSVQTVEGDLAKVQQLATILRAFHNEPSDKASFYNRMASMFDKWPVAQRQVVLEARQGLSDRMEARLARITRALREDDFIIDNPKEAFTRSIDRLMEELLRRVAVTPQNRVDIMQLRAEQAQRKRGRLPRRERKRQNSQGTEAEVSAEEISREPAKIVSCNIRDYSIAETTDAMVDEFVKDISQGNITLREDIVRMLEFMARRDLPPAHRRGVKSISGAQVKFGTEEDPDKQWDFFEFKPTEAAGLSTKTSIAKDTRIYFIKLDPDTIGIIGIKARADQDEFLRRIRVKTKRRINY